LKWPEKKPGEGCGDFQYELELNLLIDAWLWEWALGERQRPTGEDVGSTGPLIE
jgi:hypothetical protein